MKPKRVRNGREAVFAALGKLSRPSSCADIAAIADKERNLTYSMLQTFAGEGVAVRERGEYGVWFWSATGKPLPPPTTIGGRAIIDPQGYDHHALDEAVKHLRVVRYEEEAYA